MKKVIFAISVVALALVSCTQFEPETPVTFDRASAPSLTVNVTGDNSVAFEILPGKNTGYYAYAFLEGEVDPATVDGATLLAGKLSGSMDKEVANAAKKDTLKNEVKKLTPNTKYTVVAVAACSTTQTLSKVVGQTVTTSDNTIPAVSVSKATVAVEDSVMVFTVPFDDPITLTDKAAFVVMLYAINYANAAGTLQPIGAAPVPVENVSVGKDGASLVVNIPKDVYVPGEFVALNIGPGSVKNDVDSLNAAFTANTLTTKSQSGLVGQYKNVNFDLESPVAEDSIVLFQNPATVSISLEAKLAGTINQLAGYGEGGVTVTAVHGVTGRKVEYALEAWDVDKTTYTAVELGLDEAPDFGYYSTYTIDEGIVQDIFGNVNNALDLEDVALCSYGYTLADILGTYTFSGTSQYAGPQADAKVVICPSDDKDYDVMIYDLFSSTTCLDDLAAWYPDDFTKFYGTFDGDTGTLTVFGDIIGIGQYGSSYYYVGALGAGEDDEFHFAVPSPGNLILSDTVYMYLVNGGTWDRILSGTLTRTATTYEYTEPAPAPSPVKKNGIQRTGKKDVTKFIK